eukprot:maker-scaffold_8-snap-gene-6.4-mRNA-1 protein AED:0.05 eAED:0.05 QI:172/1/1/1/1/1/6/71/403
MESRTSPLHSGQPTKFQNTSTISPSDFVFQSVLGQGAYGTVVKVNKKDKEKALAMKIITKAKILKRNNTEYVKQERNILCKVEHPFIVKLHYAFQTTSRLYFVMEYLQGGELFEHLRIETFFSQEVAAFYSAEILLAVEHLHKNKIVHRDLKPENVLLDEENHVRLTDFGLAKPDVEHDGRLKTVCGSDVYMAPEIIKKTGYGKSVDWWSFGALTFEMLTGNLPFDGDNTDKIFKQILSKKPRFPKWMSEEAKDLCLGLLNKDIGRRLGCVQSTMFKIGGVKQLKSHPFYRDIDFNQILRKEAKVPFEPKKAGLENINDKQRKHRERLLSLERRVANTCLDSAPAKKKAAKLFHENFHDFTFVEPKPVPKIPGQNNTLNHLVETIEEKNECELEEIVVSPDLD